MDPHYDGRAAIVILDNMEFPQWVRAVERPPRKLGDEAPQFGLADTPPEGASA